MHNVGGFARNMRIGGRAGQIPHLKDQLVTGEKSVFKHTLTVRSRPPLTSQPRLFPVSTGSGFRVVLAQAVVLHQSIVVTGAL